MAENIRSFVQASTKLPRSRWRRSLTSLQMLVWDDMIHPSSYSGVFSYDVEEAAWYYKVSIEEIEAALALFEECGKIEREGVFVWVVDFFSHQSHTPPCLISALKELNLLQPNTRLASACDRHMRSLSDAYAALHPLNDTIRDKTKRDPTAAAGAAPEGPPASADFKPSANPKPKAQTKPHESAEPAYTPEQLALAERMERDLADLEKRGFTPGRNWRRRPEQVALSLRACQIPCERLEAAWLWALEDAFWGSQILNQGSFVQQPNRWNALVNKWLAQSNAKSQHGRNGPDLPDAEIAR